MMKERTLRVLEFTKILDMLASFAVTDMGREACEKLTPLSDLAQVNEALEETEEAQVILTYLGDSPLIGFPDVRPYLTLAAKGAALAAWRLLRCHPWGDSGYDPVPPPGRWRNHFEEGEVKS